MIKSASFVWILKKSPDAFTKINNNSEEASLNLNLRDGQEIINRKFNQCFELIDSIVPEEESQETIILRETIQELYDLLEKYDLKAEESVFFDDRKENTEAAEKLGIKSYTITSKEYLLEVLDKF